MEGLLLVSLQILRALNTSTTHTDQLGKRLLRLSAKRDALLSSATVAAPQTAAEKARWELVRYVNKVAQTKIAAKI